MTRTQAGSLCASLSKHARQTLLIGFAVASLGGLSSVCTAGMEKPSAQFAWLQSLEGDWTLTPDQEGEAARHPVIAPLVGAGRVALRYRLVGSKTTVQENIFPDTPREMATMYHCADADCTRLIADHYCSLRNQPILQAADSDVENTIRFECDPTVAICSASAAHLQTLTIERIPDDPDHLTTRFAVHKDGKLADTLVFRFERKR